MGDNWWNR